MSADFACPHCEREIDMANYPDHERAAADTGGRVDFVCEDCGCGFTLLVEWSPTFYVDEDTIRLPVTEGKAT